MHLVKLNYHDTKQYLFQKGGTYVTVLYRICKTINFKNYTHEKKHFFTAHFIFFYI